MAEDKVSCIGVYWLLRLWSNRHSSIHTTRGATAGNCKASLSHHTNLTLIIAFNYSRSASAVIRGHAYWFQNIPISAKNRTMVRRRCPALSDLLRWCIFKSHNKAYLAKYRDSGFKVPIHSWLASNLIAPSALVLPMRWLLTLHVYLNMFPQPSPQSFKVLVADLLRLCKDHNSGISHIFTITVVMAVVGISLNPKRRTIRTREVVSVQIPTSREKSSTGKARQHQAYQHTRPGSAILLQEEWLCGAENKGGTTPRRF